MKGDFAAFLKYLTSLWGLLAGLTAVFPLADVFLKVIPLPVDAYEHATAPIAIPLTTLVALFIVFYSFVQRARVTPTAARRSPWLFGLGLLALAAFFLLHHFEYPLRNWLFPGLDSTDDYVLLLVGIVPFYIAFFACMTRAFTLLALVEFRRRGGVGG
jgi:hypothetical protein